MNVRALCLQLTNLNPSYDSMKTEEDGKYCRDIIIEVRSGVKTLARIDETQENTYRTNFNGFKALTKDSQEQLTQLLDEYSATPVELRLMK